MADEVTLPELPPPSGDDGASVSRRLRVSRRKRRSGFLTSSSSDAALFSGDEDPSLENYDNGLRRRKKRYVGSWFNQLPASSTASSDSALGDEPRAPPPKLKREFKRHLDSGVFVDADLTDEFEDQSIHLEPRPWRLQALLVPRPRQKSLLENEERARQVISRCIEDGIENVDLSNLGLTSISNETITPLCGLSPFPVIINPDVPFEARDPQIKLFLSRNALSRAPAAIFNVEHLTVLSLRGNQLGELPPSIGKLVNLHTLNVGDNKLQWLPAELLGLMRYGGSLRDLWLYPNCFYQPDAAARESLISGGPFNNLAQEYEKLTFGTEPGTPPDEADEPRCFRTTLHGRTPVEYRRTRQGSGSTFRLSDALDGKMLPVEEFGQLNRPRPAHRHVQLHILDGAHGSEPGNGEEDELDRTPTLYDLALATAVRRETFEDLSLKMGETGPERLRNDVYEASLAAEIGGYTCCVCRRNHLRSSTRWLEWRVKVQHSDEGEFALHFRNGDARRCNGLDDFWIPFMRRGCSWSCVPAKVVAVPVAAQGVEAAAA